jgi:hypothetical protein
MAFLIGTGIRHDDSQPSVAALVVAEIIPSRNAVLAAQVDVAWAYPTAINQHANGIAIEAVALGGYIPAPGALGIVYGRQTDALIAGQLLQASPAAW